jgi:hypothetical protein
MAIKLSGPAIVHHNVGFFARKNIVHENDILRFIEANTSPFEGNIPANYG